ncbi:hypothetical protein MASR1M74_17560 [Lentimicrobium sp.]
MNKSRYTNILLMMMLIMVSISCSVSKRTIRKPLKEEGAAFIFESLKKNELKYHNLSARFSASFYQNKSRTTFSGQLRIQKDSLIWVSISPAFGIEMIRILITNDSIFYMNRLDKTYFTGDFNYINTKINSTLDFDMLQSFLTGNDFSFYENSTFRAGIDNHEYTLTTTGRRKLKKYVRNNNEISIPLQNLWLNPETFKITRVLIRELTPNGRKVEGSYTYEKQNNQLVPMTVSFNLETLDNKNSIEVEYTRFEIPDNLNFPFRIPDKYSRITNF